MKILSTPSYRGLLQDWTDRYMLNQHLCKEEFSEGMRVRGEGGVNPINSPWGQNSKWNFSGRGARQYKCTALQSHT